MPSTDLGGEKFTPAKLRYTGRRSRCIELRKRGYSYEVVAFHLRSEGLAPPEYGAEQARTDIIAAIRELVQKRDELAEEALIMDLLRLDELFQSHWEKALTTEVESSSLVLRIMERRARYLGLDSPTKIAPTDPTGNKEYVGAREDLERRLSRIASANPTPDVSGESQPDSATESE